MPHLVGVNYLTRFFRVYLGNKWDSMNRRDSKPHGVPFLFSELILFFGWSKCYLITIVKRLNSTLITYDHLSPNPF
jgi:hypothetical protein